MLNQSLNILGVRGSYPVFDDKFSKYGKNTTSFLYRASNTEIIIDAGTGLNNYQTNNKDVYILLTHPHLDHLLGLISAQVFWQNKNIHFYSFNFDGIDVEKQISSLLQPPLWPVTTNMMKAKFFFHNITDSFYINDVKISFILGNHPGGSLIYSLEYDTKKTIICTDFEHTNFNLDKLINFSKDAYILLYDAQYTKDEYNNKIGFGHSFAEIGLKIKKEANINEIYFVHHDPLHDDAFLDKQKEGKYAKEGDVIIYGQNE